MKAAGRIDTISTNPIDITVHSVEVDTTQPFRPIKAPVEYPLTWRDYLRYIIGAVLLILLAILIVRQLRKKRQPASAIQSIKQTKRPAHEVAMEQLLKLEQEELWQQGKVKTYHDRLSDIVRAYIEERYQIPALESTTDEISKKIRSTDLRQQQLDDLMQILHIADLAKFAKMEPTRNDNLDSMDRAKAFIQSTRPAQNSDPI
jgi:hypothetical protein